MVKATPGWVLIGTQTFPTKGEAEKFAIAERRRKGQMGYKTRFETNMDPFTGQFKVKEFYYLTDNKGNLIDASKPTL